VQVWRALEQVPADLPPTAVTVGVFDGVHRGHRHVVGHTVEVAGERGLLPVVVTFDPHPLAAVAPDAQPDALTTVEHRCALLAAAGVEGVLVLPFTAEVASWPPERFVDSVLADALHTAYLVVGENFRFGHRAAGDSALLRTLGEKHGFEVEALPLVAGDQETWSSTFVRQRLAVGDVEAAAEVLDRPHRVEGVVEEGDRRGRALGYPTANLDLPPHTAIPADGIYAGWLVRSGAGDAAGDAGGDSAGGDSAGDGEQRLPAAVSIGTNPTFTGGTKRRVEAHVIDRDDLELYGERVGVEFTARLRDTVKFDSADELVAQMADDVARAHALLLPPGP